jgi:hypothetical protein
MIPTGAALEKRGAPRNGRQSAMQPSAAHTACPRRRVHVDLSESVNARRRTSNLAASRPTLG